MLLGVIGNWSLHRIISSNLSILHNIHSEVCVPRLVMDKHVSETTKSDIDSDVQVLRKNHERASKRLKGFYGNLVITSP